MKFSFYVMSTVLALGVASADAASSAAIDRQFSAAIDKVLNGIKNQQQFLRDLSAAEFKVFVRCAQGVMQDVPAAQKQYVLAVKDAGEQRRRFDRVANTKPIDGNTTFKGRIGQECN